MLFSKLFFLATTASAAAIKRQTVGPSPEYQVTEFIAKHDNNSPNQTISFSIQSPNTGLGPTSCSATQACPDTDTDLCQLEGTPCNLEVSFTFNRAEDTRLWYLGIGYQAESELYSSRYSFTEEEDTFFEYTPGSGTTYEEILVPGGAFNFTG